MAKNHFLASIGPKIEMRAYRCLACPGRESRGGDEQSLAGLEAIKAAKEIPDGRSTYCIPVRVTFRLHVNAVEAEYVLINDAVDAAITCAARKRFVYVHNRATP